jgi:hypothetical protein
MTQRGVIATAIAAVNKGIDAVLDYIKCNGIAIIGLLALVWFIKTQCTSTSVFGCLFAIVHLQLLLLLLLLLLLIGWLVGWLVVWIVYCSSLMILTFTVALSICYDL